MARLVKCEAGFQPEITWGIAGASISDGVGMFLKLNRSGVNAGKVSACRDDDSPKYFCISDTAEKNGVVNLQVINELMVFEVGYEGEGIAEGARIALGELSDGEIGVFEAEDAGYTPIGTVLRVVSPTLCWVKFDLI